MCDTLYYIIVIIQCFNRNHIRATVLTTKSATNYTYIRNRYICFESTITLLVE